MECADENGKVPADKSGTGSESDEETDKPDGTGGGSTLPDLKVVMSPATMTNGGVNKITATITNQGKTNIDKSFVIGFEVADANGTRTKIKDKDGKVLQASLPGLLAGASKSINLFDSNNPSSGQKCDTTNPFAI